jgi:hypothetical protein
MPLSTFLLTAEQVSAALHVPEPVGLLHRVCSKNSEHIFSEEPQFIITVAGEVIQVIKGCALARKCSSTTNTHVCDPCIGSDNATKVVAAETKCHWMSKNNAEVQVLGTKASGKREALYNKYLELGIIEQ